MSIQASLQQKYQEINFIIIKVNSLGSPRIIKTEAQNVWSLQPQGFIGRWLNIKNPSLKQNILQINLTKPILRLMHGLYYEGYFRVTIATTRLSLKRYDLHDLPYS